MRKGPARAYGALGIGDVWKHGFVCGNIEEDLGREGLWIGSGGRLAIVT